MAENGRGTVVITGASSGIGAICAAYVQREGFHVIGCALPDSDGQEMMARASATFTPLYMDVTDAASIASAVDNVRAALGHGGLAGLVNNAGIGGGGPLEFMHIEYFSRVLEVNVIGHVAVTQAFLPQLREAEGRIVFMGSMLGRCAAPFSSAYSASKSALVAVADSLRMELRPWGIYVSLIEPAVVRTPILDKALAQAEELINSLSPEQRALYEGTFGAARRRMQTVARTAIVAEEVAKRVVQALTATTPRTRYPVGRQAKLMPWLRFIPDRWRDRILLSAMR